MWVPYINIFWPAAPNYLVNNSTRRPWRHGAAVLQVQIRIPEAPVYWMLNEAQELRWDMQMLCNCIQEESENSPILCIGFCCDDKRAWKCTSIIGWNHGPAYIYSAYMHIYAKTIMLFETVCIIDRPHVRRSNYRSPNSHANPLTILTISLDNFTWLDIETLARGSPRVRRESAPSRSRSRGLNCNCNVRLQVVHREVLHFCVR